MRRPSRPAPNIVNSALPMVQCRASLFRCQPADGLGLTGFMGATYWMVPDESRTELYSMH